MHSLRIALVALASCLACGGKAQPAIKTVFLIVLENHDWSTIRRSDSAPYLDNTLIPLGSHAEHYFNPPNLHPSEPNYLWLEAGTNFGVTDDNLPAVNHQSTTQHLTTLLNQKGISWKSYQQGIDGLGCPTTAVNQYAPKHNPMVFFDDVTGDLAYCSQHERPLSELAGDLSAGPVARYNFITPDLCHDMHDNCAPANNAIEQGDLWLSSTIPAILASAAYRDHGLILITWDESELFDLPIGLIALSPLAKGNGYFNQVPYTHSSTLRSLQEIFQVTPLLGDAANATDLSDLFKQFP